MPSSPLAPFCRPLEHLGDFRSKFVEILRQSAATCTSSSPPPKLRPRSFAFLQLCGDQRRVTEGDSLIVLGTHFLSAGPIGTHLRLNKVLLYGTHDFTLIGKPILPENLVGIKAVLVERRLDHLKVTGHFRRRKRFRKTYPYQEPMSILRILEIKLNQDLLEDFIK
ncbi:MAG: 39S ribosomal protein L21, mitochondrial [Marteilia pararefringens]